MEDAKEAIYGDGRCKRGSLWGIEGSKEAVKGMEGAYNDLKHIGMERSKEAM